MIEMRDRLHGMFLGIAIGDALYAPVETWTASKISEAHGRLKTYVDPSSHKRLKGRPVGSWTDDTQLTLLVADSLIEKKEFDIDDLSKRHVEYWEREGDLGFGKTTRKAIKRLKQGVHWSKSGITTDPNLGTGNALPMKIAPLVAYSVSPFFFETRLFKTRLRDFTLMTHYTQMAVQSALAHVAAIQFCFQDDNGRTDYDFPGTLVSAIERHGEMLKGIPAGGNGDDLKWVLSTLNNLPVNSNADDFIRLFGEGKCYVYHTLPFCYAFFLKHPTNIETLYDVGNAGGDTDTNASIVGGMLGALNGASIFPQHLIDGLWQKDRIIATANKFYETFFLEKMENGS